VLGESFSQRLKGATGFDGDGKVGPGVLEDAVQACGGQDEIGARGRIAPAEFCRAPARDDGEACFVGKAERGG